MVSLAPPATRSNPAARPSAPVAVLLAAAASHNARASPLWSPPPLEATDRIRGHSQSRSQNESGWHERRDTITRMAIWAVWAICSAFLVYVIAVE